MKWRPPSRRFCLVADRYLIRHSESQLHLGEGIIWVSCHAEALVLTRLEVKTWLSLACESELFEVVPAVLAGTDCCAA